jgi:hypothetical protein
MPYKLWGGRALGVVFFAKQSPIGSIETPHDRPVHHSRFAAQLFDGFLSVTNVGFQLKRPLIERVCGFSAPDRLKRSDTTK